jgi:hypothetical protein
VRDLGDIVKGPVDQHFVRLLRQISHRRFRTFGVCV